jgi:hypothetical protein
VAKPQPEVVLPVAETFSALKRTSIIRGLMRNLKPATRGCENPQATLKLHGSVSSLLQARSRLHDAAYWGVRSVPRRGLR